MYTYLLIILLKKDASSYKKTKKYVCLLTTYTEIHFSHLSLKYLKVFSIYQIFPKASAAFAKSLQSFLNSSEF